MVRNLRIIVVGWLLAVNVVAVADSAGTKETGGEAKNAPFKSEIDEKSYRGLVLDNGMKVLLVSDPRADRAAAALDVHVGSGSDPEEWNGLAHFLEHMLFLGNGKYPEAGEYQKFIKSQGGSNNAYTSYDHTNYFFSVNHGSLLPALDRFSRFFIDPTFENKFVSRERSVVHSEYQARLKDEGRRIWAAQKQLLNPRHPASRFSVGSEESLRDREESSVRDKLIEFYQRYYSANIMALSVVGREPLDTLEGWVRERFAPVSNHDIAVPSYPQSYLNKELRPVRIKIVPERELNSVSFQFAIPSTMNDYDSRPAGYIGHLLGHEGEGSLLAALKARGWADNLSAGQGFMDQNQGAMVVSIGLTVEGMDHVNEIGSMLFYFIGLIRDKGIAQWRFEEEQKLGQVAFQFAQEGDAGSLAQSLAARLQRYPFEDVLRGPYVVNHFAPEKIGEVLSYLQPSKVYVQEVSQRFKVRKRSPWYDVAYGIEPIESAVIETWEQAEKHSYPELALAKANPFIPERLVLQKLQSGSEKPVQLDIEGVEAWYQGDQEFKTPRAKFYFSAKSPHANSSPRETLLTELFVRLVNDQLNKVTYPAILAGLDYSLYRHSRGVSVRIGGYQDRQGELLKVILDTMENPDFDADKFALLKAEAIRVLKNSDKERPSNQVTHEVYRLLMQPYWTEGERLAVADDLTLSDLKDHVALLFGNVALTTLAHGDVSVVQAEEMTASVVNAFADATKVADVERMRTRALDDGTTSIRTMGIDHQDTALVVYFQGAKKSPAARARAALLGQLIESPFYFDLRTTHRVGYLVYGTNMTINSVPGLILSVQSPTHTPVEINQLFETFLAGFPMQLEQMSEEAFIQTKQGLLAQLTQRDTNLAGRTDRYWREIDQAEYDFDSREILVREVEGLDKVAVIEYFAGLVGDDARKVVVQSPGTRDGAIDGVVDSANLDAIKTVEAFRQSHRNFFPAL